MSDENIKIARLRDSSGVELIRDHLVANDDYAYPELLINALKENIENDPENTFLVMGYEEAEDSAKTPIVKSFIYGVCGEAQEHSYVFQAWTEKGRKSLSDKIWEHFKQWSRNMGRTCVRMQSTRSPAAMKKRFGFEVDSIMFKYDLIAKEPVDEQEERAIPNDDQHTKQVTTPDC